MTTLSVRARAIVLSLIALGFMSGAAAGVAADRLATRNVIRLRVDMAGVLDQLQLTPDQRRRADSIVARSAPRSEAIMLEARERLHAVADSLDGELRGILTAEQRTRLDSMRTGSRMLLKRKVVGPKKAAFDTVFDSSVKSR